MRWVSEERALRRHMMERVRYLGEEEKSGKEKEI